MNTLKIRKYRLVKDNKLLCERCGTWKPLSDFHRNRSKYWGVQSSCKKCFKKLYYHHDPKEKRKRHILRYYGIGWDKYNALYVQQKGKCGICESPIKMIGDKDIKSGAHIDHCHKTGMIRGLLCHGCNAGLGYFSENIESMKKAITYLEYFKHKG